MNKIELSKIFDVTISKSFDLNSLTKVKKGIKYVGRTKKNNGITALVKYNGHKLNDGNCITVPMVGVSTLFCSFQEKNFYASQNIAILRPLDKRITKQVCFYYMLVLKENHYRFSYGRTLSLRELKKIKVPEISEIPTWVNQIDITKYENIDKPFFHKSVLLNDTNDWKYFYFKDLFRIEKGQPLKNKDRGNTEYVTSTSFNNGVSGKYAVEPIFDGNTITLTANGSVCEPFYHENAYWANPDVNVLIPKFKLNKYIAIFICTLLRLEKYRYNYGRKSRPSRIKNLRIKLPICADGNIDLNFMEIYIKSLNFSSSI